MPNPDYQGVWACLDQADGKISGVSLEVLSAARRLADMLSVQASAVLLGHSVDGLAAEAFAYGADRVYVCDDEKLKDYRAATYGKALESLIRSYRPTMGMIWPPGLPAAWGRGCVPIASVCSRMRRAC